ncbi:MULTISPECIES: hypothetical protein [unclassified Novosphingobium]|nr:MULTISPECIES: hypothetical protein [unclassified Novosphingobium]PTR05193.1 hypothetical protein C8K11_1417 [Novosphingobium sp. GV055]PUA93757.1 hypothetical protein C8K12_1427 [Novosphingobium sp. GV061]PUB10565.1 hypothetical protein C8K14_1422 [Novosphingobium sp. GV079]PUB36460.1 hypothetical protein C8K10_1417 [Novosphingobium sp. GV027]
MQIQPNVKAALSGWTSAIDSVSWLAESLEIALGACGLKQRLELQTA